MTARLQLSPRSRDRLRQQVGDHDADFVLSSADGRLSVRVRLTIVTDPSDQVIAPDARCLIDWSLGTITRGSRRITLSRTELRLLAALMDDQGDPVSRAVLIRRVWPGTSLTTAQRENALGVYVCLLRKRLSSIGLGSALETVRGIGYRLTL